MQEHNVFITYEAIYDIVEAEEYIKAYFGDKRADKYRKDIKAQISALSDNANIYKNSGFMYRNYVIYMKPFVPALIFWVVKEDGVHILRILREEQDWQGYFESHRYHEYTYPDDIKL